MIIVESFDRRLSNSYCITCQYHDFSCSESYYSGILIGFYKDDRLFFQQSIRLTGSVAQRIPLVLYERSQLRYTLSLRRWRWKRNENLTYVGIAGKPAHWQPDSNFARSRRLCDTVSTPLKNKLLVRTERYQKLTSTLVTKDRRDLLICMRLCWRIYSMNWVC